MTSGIDQKHRCSEYEPRPTPSSNERPPLERNLLGELAAVSGGTPLIPLPHSRPDQSQPTPTPDIKRKIEPLPELGSGFFERTALAIKYYVLRFFAWVRGEKMESEIPAGLKKPYVLRQIPDELFNDFTTLRTQSFVKWLRENIDTYFSAERKKEIFRAISRSNNVERGNAIFDREPLSIFLYLTETRWQASEWGFFERLANSIKDKIVRRLDSNHTAICVKAFREAVEEETGVKIERHILLFVPALRAGLSSGQLRAQYIGKGKEEDGGFYRNLGKEISFHEGEEDGWEQIGRAAFERDPFCVLLYLSPHAPDHVRSPFVSPSRRHLPTSHAPSSPSPEAQTLST